MKILFVCTWKTPYLVQIWQYIKKYYSDVNFSVLTLDTDVDFFVKRLELDDAEHIYTYKHVNDPFFFDMRRTINKLPHFDVVHFLFIDWYYGLWINDLAKKTDTFFVSVGGSDLYRHSKNRVYRYFQKRIIKHADWLSSENEPTRDYFYKVYGKKCSAASHSIIRFGVDILDSINNYHNSEADNCLETIKQKWKVPSDKIVVTLGYNGRIEHQHLKMIDAFSKCAKDMLNGFFFIVPMTYAVTSEEYVTEVTNGLQSLVGSDGFVILRDFMNVDEMAETVMISDVMIHIQTTDQLSSTMLAHMYNGNIVIAGDWLPYGFLRDEGVNFYSISEFDELSWYLEDIYDKIDCYKVACTDNKEIIYRLSSWESMAGEWHNVYETLKGKDNDTTI